MDSGCCETTFTLRVPHQKMRTDIPEKKLSLELFRGCPGPGFGSVWVGPDWLKVHAKLCAAGSSQCEAATSAKIHLDFVSTNGKHASGSFSVDFPNAGHEEGKFAVKQHHEGPRYICE